MTAFGLLLFPVCLAFALRPIALLQLALIASVFEAAAALNLGGLGLQPAIIPSTMFCAYVLLQLLLGVQYSGQREIWRPIVPMAMFAAWALAASVALPHLFEGQVSVHPQKLEPPFAAVLLQPTTAGLNQDIYLLVDCAMLLFTSLLTCSSIAQPSKVIKAYFWSGYLAVAVGIWQFANKIAGVPFPDSFFYSNPGWSILATQQVGLVPRINGSFAEPSAFAGFMVGIACSTAWVALNGPTTLFVRGLLGSAVMMVLLSTSTTGYGVLAILGTLASVYALVRGTRRMQHQVLRLGIIVALTLVVTTLTTTAFFPEVNEAASQVFASTLDKQDSQSYEERSAADSDSLDLAVQTYGLGVGWGGNRSSSLIPGILGNVGVIGMACLIWFGCSLTRLASKASRVMANAEDLVVVRGATGAILGTLTAALLAGPSITSLSFFALLGLLIGTSARALAQADVLRTQGQQSAAGALAARDALTG